MPKDKSGVIHEKTLKKCQKELQQVILGKIPGEISKGSVEKKNTRCKTKGIPEVSPGDIPKEIIEKSQRIFWRNPVNVNLENH